METPPQENSKKQICTARIVFAFESDEEFLALKRKLDDAVGETKGVMSELTISKTPRGLRGMPF